VLQEEPKDYPRGKVVDPMRPMLGNGLPMTDGEVWRRKRRAMQPAFNKVRIAKLTDTMSAVTKRNVDKFRENDRFDAHELMMRLTRDIIVETMFSNQLGADTSELDAAFVELERYVARYSFFPFKVPLFSGQVAIVTGAGRGLGRLFHLQLEIRTLRGAPCAESSPYRG